MRGQWELSPGHLGPGGTIADVWRHRRLLRFIGDRALRKTYKRTVLGWLWLFINPLFPLALRALIFGALLGVGSNGLPYFLFLVGGTVIWDAFATTLTWGTRSLEMNRNLTEQIYLPRAVLPFGNAAPAFLDLALKSGVFVLALVYYALRDDRVYIRGDIEMLWSLAALLLAWLFAVSLSLFTSVWGETARDVRFALGQLLSVWYLMTPVLYPLSTVPAEHRQWMLINPMTVIVETFKWGLFGVGELPIVPLAVTAAAVLVLLIVGLFYFAHAEARAVDER